MTHFPHRIIALSNAAWRLREASRTPCELPFAFALFTDDRRQSDILALLGQLPPVHKATDRIAVIFRHDHLEARTRLTLAKAAMAITQDKGHLFLFARGQLSGADGHHSANGKGIVSQPIHSLQKARRAISQQVDLGFISPVFATKSHTAVRALGPARATSIVRKLPFPCFALGGINLETVHRLHGYPFSGFGAIGAAGD